MTSDLRARRRYARRLKYNGWVKYLAGETIVKARFISVTKDRACVIVSLGYARKFVELSRLVMPAAAPKPSKKKPVSKIRQLPRHLRNRLGIGL